MKAATSQYITIQNKVEFATQLQAALPGLIFSIVPSTEGLLVRTAPSRVRALALFFRSSSHLQFRSLVDIAVTDKLRPNGRFVVNYLFLSMPTNQRLVLQLFVNETTTIPSLAVPFANGQRLFAAAS